MAEASLEAIAASVDPRRGLGGEARRFVLYWLSNVLVRLPPGYDIAMHGMVNGGWGQVYLDNYYSGDKESGLDGGKSYRLHIADPDVYAEVFWNITVYNVENRAIIANDQERADVGSNVPDTVYNDDGSVTFYFAPVQPEGAPEANWIQTNQGENWFVYFRAYSPKPEFVAQEPKTILPNFELVDTP